MYKGNRLKQKRANHSYETEMYKRDNIAIYNGMLCTKSWTKWVRVFRHELFNWVKETGSAIYFVFDGAQNITQYSKCLVDIIMS